MLLWLLRLLRAQNVVVSFGICNLSFEQFVVCVSFVTSACEGVFFYVRRGVHLFVGCELFVVKAAMLYESVRRSLQAYLTTQSVGHKGYAELNGAAHRWHINSTTRHSTATYTSRHSTACCSTTRYSTTRYEEVSGHCKHTQAVLLGMQ